MSNEKQRVAFTSVVAAVFLTLVKIIVGVFTGSLGILSEAAHSALDLVAAVVTFFAVKLSDKPADKDHHYGHGKIESFSALIETLLLLATCAWIIYEALERLFGAETVGVSNEYWGIGIMVLSIVINISRARALKRVAKKYGSQALEADALHFESDVWSSFVVIGGLVCVWLGNVFDIPALGYGDPIAALGVSALVIVVSIKLGKRTIDVLLDTAPQGMVNEVLKEVNAVKGVLDVDSIRIRPSGPHFFIDLNVGINRNESHRVVHLIVHEIRERIQRSIPNSDIMISTYPIGISGNQDRGVYHTVKKVVDRFPICTNIHNIHVYEELSGKKTISTHLEIKESMNLNDSHHLSHELADLIKGELTDVQDVSVTFEYVKQNHIFAEDVTDKSREMILEIEGMVNKVPQKLNCHDIKVYSEGEKLTVFLHCEICDNYEISKIEKISKNISNKIKKNIQCVENVHVHVEPMEG
ncbi:MAG: cation-efflux pump [Clostridia bacterium]|nr:cation-efflux pump [Clostridia bacterium]